MLRNYLAAALRNLARNRLYAGITIFGLAVGFAAALLIGLYVRDELTYDRFVPGYERVYRVSQTITIKGSAPIESDVTPMMMAKPLALAFPEIERVARLSPAYFPPTVRRGEIVTGEQNFAWGDPGFLRVVPLPVLAGDPATALDAPDSIVLTRASARKYFGRDAPIGETLLVENRPFRVTAVLKDLPSNTHLLVDMIASSRSSLSPFGQYEAVNGPLTNTLGTYFRLKPGASTATMKPRLAQFLEQGLPLGKFGIVDVDRALTLVPLADIHLRPSTQGATIFKPAVDRTTVAAIGAVGLLIVLVAAINFITLMTARAARRAVEVGVRKAAGARQRDLIVQFMGEAFLYVLLSGVLAVALAELLLPAFNALLQRKIVFNYVGDPGLAGVMFGVVAVTALLAGAYPAFVLSGFRPAAVLKGGPVQGAGSGPLREALVVVQFAVLVALVVVAATIARQTLFALNEGMRVNKDQVLLVFSQPCVTAMRDEVRRVRGVRAASCASASALNLSNNRDAVIYGGRRYDLTQAQVDFGFLELFGVHPIAGRLFDRTRPADGVLDSPVLNPPVVLNETAVRRLGFASPQAALGKTLNWHGNWDVSLKRDTYTIQPIKPSTIIGVVPDFTFGSVRQAILPTMYSIGRPLPPDSVAMAVKLDGKQTPETLASIDRLWKRLGHGKPILRVFVDLFTMRLYLDAIIQGATIAAAAAIALSIACLGLFALSAYTTERRTKEIGIRKAMGASSSDILRLLLWQFTRPVLIANLLALPAAWLVMDWWLKGFVYHVDVAVWTLAAAALAAVLIAWGTVFVHALRVARARPVAALRYE
jgi:putative ABC transport system permease protein